MTYMPMVYTPLSSAIALCYDDIAWERLNPIFMGGRVKMAYTLIRSDRKTLAIQVKAGLDVVVRAPRRLPLREIERFLSEHADWIDRQTERLQARSSAYPEPTKEEEATLRTLAKAYFPGRVAYFAALMNVMPTAVRITSAKTRFGSCSGKNSLSFSLRLMRYPPEAIDYVVVHELAHITHKDHGKAFYQTIEGVLPDYRARRATLR